MEGTVGICDIDEDVLGIIFEMVHQASPRSILAIMLCNKRLHMVARPFSVRHLLLDMHSYRRAETQCRILRLLEDDSSWARAAIRTITARATLHGATVMRSALIASWLAQPSEWVQLVSLLSLLPKLVDFIFDCPSPMPLCLISALQELQPQASLHVRHWTRESPDIPFDYPPELALAESPQLRTLDADVWYGMREADYQWPAFVRIISRAPNLHAFGWRRRHVGGCVMYSTSYEDAAIRNNERKRFRVQPTKKAIKSVDHASLDSYALRALAHIVDWAKVESLRELQLENNAAIQLNPEALSSLSTLEVRMPVCTDEDDPQRRQTVNRLSHFLALLRPLECLSIMNLHDLRPLQAVLLHHGPRLRKLHLHEMELPIGNGPTRRTLTPEQLAVINRACYCLEDFALDLDRTPAHTYEDDVCAALAQFPALRKLTLHLDLGLGRFTHRERVCAEAYTPLNASHAVEAWHFVQQRKVGVPLEELVVCVGEQDRELGWGYPATWMVREHDERRYFRVIPHERDDRPGEVIVQTHRQ
ncbi:hypothetical protein HDZ31DRAFT_37347 [Schizophyllum fasciatum]